MCSLVCHRCGIHSLHMLKLWPWSGPRENGDQGEPPTKKKNGDNMGSQASRYSYEKVIEKRLKRAGWQRLLGDKEQCLMGVTFQIKLHDCLNQFSHTSHSARVLGFFSLSPTMWVCGNRQTTLSERWKCGTLDDLESGANPRSFVKKLGAVRHQTPADDGIAGWREQNLSKFVWGQSSRAMSFSLYRENRLSRWKLTAGWRIWWTRVEKGSAFISE